MFLLTVYIITVIFISMVLCLQGVHLCFHDCRAINDMVLDRLNFFSCVSLIDSVLLVHSVTLCESALGQKKGTQLHFWRPADNNCDLNHWQGLLVHWIFFLQNVQKLFCRWVHLCLLGHHHLNVVKLISVFSYTCQWRTALQCSGLEADLTGVTWWCRLAGSGGGRKADQMPLVSSESGPIIQTQQNDKSTIVAPIQVFF